MFQLIFLALGVLALSWVIAGFLMARSRTLLGIILGALVIVLAIYLMRWSIQNDINECLIRACATAGLPEGCGVGEFGCNEGGAGLVMTNLSGWVSLSLYVVGVFVIGYVQSRRN